MTSRDDLVETTLRKQQVHNQTVRLEPYGEISLRVTREIGGKLCVLAIMVPEDSIPNATPVRLNELGFLDAADMHQLQKLLQ
jgi:hypothetical protein